MAFKEKDFQSLFTKWVNQTSPHLNVDFTFVYELKVTDKDKLRFDQIKPHQIPALQQAKHKHIHHKISDMALGFHPFDGIKVVRVPAYLIILFYKPRQLKVPIWIDVDKFVEFQKASKYKYITEEDAKKIGINFGGI